MGGAGADEASAALVPLRFAAEDRAVVEQTFTLTVGPQDACVPAGCALRTAAGQEPAFVKPIDLSSVLPDGLHAFVELRATYTAHASDSLDALGNWNLQWSGADLWVSGAVSDDAQGNATLSGYVTNHGPDAPQAVLVILEPDGGAEDTEVTVHVRVTPLDDAVHRTHVVGVELGGGAVPVTVEMDGGGALDVRGPDDSLVLTEEVVNGTTVTLPARSPAGLYKLVVFDTDATTRFLVPAANLTEPTVRVLDTTTDPGEAREVPSNGVLEWKVDAPRPPYMFRVRFDGLDGRSAHLDARLTVKAPGGETVIEGDVDCGTCVYSSMSWGNLAGEGLVSGEYTVTLDVSAAQGWTVQEAVGYYGR